MANINEMAILDILTFPNPQLQKVSMPIETFDEDLRRLVDDMVETMRKADGIGLAAPQIGELKRLVVVEIPSEIEGEEGQRFTLCNPKITRKEGRARIEEGCLSLPGFAVEVDRAKEITIEGKNVDGSDIKLDADGMLAICLQHEMDHLEGRLLVHYVSTVKRQLYKSEMKRRARSPESFDDPPPAL